MTASTYDEALRRVLAHESQSHPNIDQCFGEIGGQAKGVGVNAEALGPPSDSRKIPQATARF
jgi:hypothetical protein